MKNIEKKLRNNGVAIAVTEGDSMEPMLKSGDVVLIQKPTFPLKVYDIPVYKRENHLTMHRIVRVKNGKYIICADNRTRLEKDITESDIIGVLVGFYKNGKYISLSDSKYLEYCKSLDKMYFERVWEDFCSETKNRFKYLLKGGRN